MSAEYSRDHCKLAVGKILQTIGWHSINSTPLEVLTDILTKYIRQIARFTNEYSNEFGQTEPNLDHLGLAFQEVGVNLAELEEYVTYVNFVPAAAAVPKYPIPKESNLNFLKPGSKEVVTRPIHINEHLPPMYPLLEEQTDSPADGATVKTETVDDVDHFKKPSDLILPEFRRSKKDEESSRPTREISSVMMTTSGYLSPACEGKLPERKAPVPPPEPPKVPSPAPDVPELFGLGAVKKKAEKRKEKASKEPFKSLEDRPKKSHSSKEPKIKPPKIHTPHLGPGGLGNWNQPHFSGDVRIPPSGPLHKSPTKSSFNKTLAAAKAKTEKLNTTITPIPIKTEPAPAPVTTHHQVDKLVTEPDKKKINILKKISNVKEKHEKPPKHHMSPHMMQQTRDIVNKINLSSDITIEPINPPVQRNPDYLFEDGGSSSTPKIPELMAYSPPLTIKERRKRKDKLDKPKTKKLRKQAPPAAHFMDPTGLDLPMEDNKPPPPEPPFIRQPPLPPYPIPNQPFRLPLSNFGGPGLIPHPFSTPLFPFSAMMPNIPEPPIVPPISKPEPPQPPPPPKLVPKNPEPIKQETTEFVPSPRAQSPNIPNAPNIMNTEEPAIGETPKKSKEHKKDKKDKIKKKNKKEKVKDKSEKKKLKEAKKEKDKEKKKKKVPKEEVPPMDVPIIPKILLKVNSPSPRPETPDANKKLNIKPVVKKEDFSPERKRETSPGLAKISALVTGPPKPKNPSPVLTAEKTSSESPSPTTASRPPGRPRIHPLKSKPIPKVKKVQQPYTRQDADGNTVWFCPECDLQDDGRPMIGCDGCDAWYHWVCVGIQVPPDNNENWYCRKCLAKKNADLSSKKKKRKKKNQP